MQELDLCSNFIQIVTCHLISNKLVICAFKNVPWKLCWMMYASLGNYIIVFSGDGRKQAPFHGACNLRIILRKWELHNAKLNMESSLVFFPCFYTRISHLASCDKEANFKGHLSNELHRLKLQHRVLQSYCGIHCPGWSFLGFHSGLFIEAVCLSILRIRLVHCFLFFSGLLFSSISS